METDGAIVSSWDAITAARQYGRRVSLIMIDVDGNELSVLRGARETIARHQPAIVIEIAPYFIGMNLAGLRPPNRDRPARLPIGRRQYGCPGCARPHPLIQADSKRRCDRYDRASREFQLAWIINETAV